MSRSIHDLEEELTRIWGLVSELSGKFIAIPLGHLHPVPADRASEQLSHNRMVVAQLRARSDNVKGQAAHVGAGFPLRRFNLDISDEDFHSELEAFASHLVLENQQLQHENKQLNALLKEYEQTLETVMGKFRGVSHASQQHDLSLHSYYTSLLQTLQTAHSSAQLHDDTSLSLLLTRLSTLLRSALRSMGGEDVELDLVGLTNGNGQDKISDLGSIYSSPPSPSKSSSSGKKSVIQRAPPRPTPFPGCLPGASGGYSGTEGRADWALEREMEILRLEEENRSLREMLAIAEESAQPNGNGRVSPEEPEHEPEPVNVVRKSSLTVEELELGAEQEAAEKEARDNQPPGTGLGGGAGVQNGTGSSGRHVLYEGSLGFRPELVPPEEAIEDGPDG